MSQNSCALTLKHKVIQKGIDCYRNTLPHSGNIDPSKRNHTTYCVKLDDFFDDIPHHTKKSVEVFYGQERNSRKSYLFTRRSQQVYQSEIFSEVKGIWFPLGLVNLTSGDNDTLLDLKVTPVSVAVGFKWTPLDSPFYFGFSGLSGVTVSSDDDKTVTKIGVGGVIDFNGLFYLGPYIELGRDNSNVAYDWSMVVGLGPRIVGALGDAK